MKDKGKEGEVEMGNREKYSRQRAYQYQEKGSRSHPRTKRRKKTRSNRKAAGIVLGIMLLLAVALPIVFHDSAVVSKNKTYVLKPTLLEQTKTFTFEQGAGIRYTETVAKGAYPKIPPPAVVLPGIVMFNGAAKGKVCLTFDDGPYVTMTGQYLEILKNQRVPAVFFLPANRVSLYPEIAKSIADYGQEVASHSFKHLNLKSLTGQTVKDDFARHQSGLSRCLRLHPKYIRPPYGNYNDEVCAVAKSYGQQPIHWSIDTNDWRGYSADTLVNTVSNNLHDGAIILFHEGKQNTLAALPRVIKAVRDKGYEFVTLDELLANYPK